MADINDVIAQSERDAERARARLKSSVDKLKDNLSPGPLVSELMSNGGKSGEALMNSIIRTAKENPIAVALIGIGAMLLMVPAERDRRPRSSNTSNESSGRLGASDMKDRIAAPIGKATEKVSGLVSTLGDTVVDIKDRAGDVAGRLTDAAGQATGTTRNYLASGARYAKDQVGAMGSSLKDITRSLSEVIDEQPLVIAAVGIAAGAAIGAALPVTQTENDYLGGVSDSAMRAASDMATQQYDRVKSVAEGALNEVTGAVTQEDTYQPENRTASTSSY
jgi:ElaB/YqjD/DUF883 family membrane-anchored ribosome-binding protein